jgi:hypothetical protein
MTAPLTPPDLDLRDFDWMPLDVARLRDSDLSVLAPGDAFRAAVLLWCASWHQVPAASLPTEERLLANLAGYGRDLKGWTSVRTDALRGFIKCSDGRLYHPVVAEKAIEADGQRKKQRNRTAAATSARRGGKRNDQRDDDRNDHKDGPRNEDHLTLPDLDQTLPEHTHTAAGSEAPPDVRDWFEEFWKEYPARDGDNPKLPAKLKFEALVKTGVDPDLIIAGAKRYAAKAREKQQVGTQYIAHALKWLGEQRWADVAAVAFLAGERAADPQPKDWLGGVQRWMANESHWPRWAGPVPGATACRCPPDILIQCGVDPESGMLMSRLVKIVAGTDEMAALAAYRQSRNLRAPKVYKIEVDGREQEVCWAQTQWPPGFNDFGERLAPTNAEDAA